MLEIMKRYDYKGIPMPLVRRMTKQVLIGLDYLHRKCRIIHTDLKPENVIISLTKDELSEIQKRGQISTMNKTVKTQDVTKDGTLFPGVNQKSTLLAGVDTTGMSKQQKKKLRKKMKKALGIGNDGLEGGEEDDTESTMAGPKIDNFTEGTTKATGN